MVNVGMGRTPRRFLKNLFVPANNNTSPDYPQSYINLVLKERFSLFVPLRLPNDRAEVWLADASELAIETVYTLLNFLYLLEHKISLALPVTRLSFNLQYLLW